MASTSQAPSIDNLYRDHQDWLRAWLRRRLDCSETAEDLAHDTFLRLLAAKRSQGLAENPRALLTHIARGLVVDHWRRQSVERAYLEALAQRPIDEAPSAEAQALIIESLVRIDEMLSSMPPRIREIFPARPARWLDA